MKQLLSGRQRSPHGPRTAQRRRLRAAFEPLEPRQLLAADLAITEFLASNATSLADGDGDTPDWIELHNGGTETIDLEGWSLTDDPGEPDKWSLPIVRLEPDAYLVVFASGKDRAADSFRLTSDFHSTPDGTFLIDLPSGQYDVRLTMGDVERVRDEVAVLLQGEEVDRVTVAAGRFAMRHYRAEVGPASGGQLAIRLRDMGGETGRAVINALVVTPTDGGTPLRFDFDAEQSPTEPTFVSVATDQTYSAERGYGWQEGLVVSSQDRGLDKDDLHTNFKLRAAGDYLALRSPEGTVVSEFAAGGQNYPQQRTDVSFGATADGPRYLSPPTPGAANGTGYLGWAADPTLSLPHGFYDRPQTVEIRTASPTAEIYYTTDGSPPEPGNPTARLSTGSLQVDATTVLRAAAFKPGYLPSRVATRSYLFVEDIIEQDFERTVAAGLPETWGRGAEPDYGMDPDVIGQQGQDLFGGIYAARIRDSLQAIPTLSIVMNADDLFGTTGIYSISEGTGELWERPTSVELIYPDGRQGFQIDAGIRIQGGAFRSIGLTRKNSLRLLFKDKYGDGKLRFPFFGEDAAQQFDTITLRMESNDGWQWAAAGGQPQFARDEFMRRTQLAMGQPASHGNRMHLYINGVYWGMYNPVERPDQSFGASYFGADKRSWDGINSGNPPSLVNVINAEDDIDRIRRALRAWRAMIALTEEVKQAENETERTAILEKLQGNFPDGTDDPSQEDLLDVDNLIDYMIVNFYGGNSDWPQKNYYVGRENSPDSTGFKFFSWDAEWSLLLRNNVHTNRVDAASGVAAPFQNLRASEEFRLRFADHVQRHFSEGGALYVDPEHPEWDPERPEANVPAARYVQVTDEVYDGLIAESARWGDQHRELPYTRDAEWRAERDRLLSDWFPQRSAIVLEQFRQAGLYPAVDAPRFNQQGGPIRRSFDIELRDAGSGAVYYTLDGSDPRLRGGDVSPTAARYQGPFRLARGATIKARRLEDGQWSALSEAAFVVLSDLPLRITEMNVQPHPANLAADLGERQVDNDRFEFVELANVGDAAIDLEGVSLVETDRDGDLQGITFTFGAQRLAPGERTVIARDRQAFVSRYGRSRPLAVGTDGRGGPDGQYGGKLSNRGEHITLLDAQGAVIHDFHYRLDGPWPARAAGQGSSLEVIDTRGDYNDSANWRASTDFGGSPFEDGSPPNPRLRINEIVAGPADEDAARIELFNPTDTAIDVGGWYVSDADEDLFRTRIPAGITVPAGGYQTLAGPDVGFALDRLGGGRLLLVESDAGGRPRRFGDRVEFAGTRAGVSLGRWPDGDAKALLFPMASPTMGAANAGPAAAEVIISEVHYRPAVSEPFSQNFDTGTARGFTPVQGNWQVVDGRYRVTPGSQGDTFSMISGVGAVGNRYRISATVNIPAQDEHFRNVALIFDYRGPTDFKFVSAHAGSGEWRVGRRDADGWNFLDRVNGAFFPDMDLRVVLDVADTSISLRVGEFDRLRYNFGAPLGGGAIGVGSKNGEAIFDNLVVEPLSDPDDFAFVELFAMGDQPVDLAGWRLAGDVTWQFTDPTVLQPGEALVVSSFSPIDRVRSAALRGVWSIGAAVPVVGAFSGELNGQRGLLELLAPLENGGTTAGYRLVDRAIYRNEAPWPTAADGGGLSLHRTSADAFGALPASYRPLPPSPGRERFARPGDTDLSGRIDTGDIQGIVLALTDPETYASTFGAPAALGGDLDGDGDVDFDDIAELVRVLRPSASVDAVMSQWPAR